MKAGFFCLRLHATAFMLLTDPFAEQRGFPKASRGGDEDHARRVLESIVQPLNQTRARDELWSRRRDVELGG
jgi:hypothetical protein